MASRAFGAEIRKAAKLDWNAIDPSVFMYPDNCTSGDESLERLLALNLERASEETPIS